MIYIVIVLASILPNPANSAAHDEPQRIVVAADSSRNLVARVDASGALTWKYRIGPLHDLQQLENGNLLFQTSWTRLVEIDPRTNDVVWQYDCQLSNRADDRVVEIHAFQRLPDGNTMIAESGASRIIEVDRAGRLVHEVKLQVAEPHPHRDTRLARKLPNGHYLVCHEGEGTVREYAADGTVTWEYEVPLFGKQPRPGHGVDSFGNKCFSATRLANGNTLIGTGNGHSVLEVTPAKKIVWRLDQDDLPGIRLAWVTTVQLLPNGNLVIGNCHAGPENPQIVEITRDKQVVWSFHDFRNFGNALTNSIVTAK